MVTRALALIALAGCAVEGNVLRSGEDGGGADAIVLDGGGDAGGCPAVGDCPDPPAGDITVCGRVLDLQTSSPITAGPPTVRVFDFVDLRLDPAAAIAAATVTPDACGWFTTTVDGLIGIIVVHTGELPPATGDHRRVVEVVTTAPGQTVRANAWALRGDTDAAWSAAAGLGGETFADLGSLLAIYVDVDQPAVPPLQGAPLAGATVLINGQDVPADDFYFADPGPLARSQLVPGQAAAGADGSGLLRDVPPLAEVSGQAPGCAFPAVNTLSIGGTLQVQEIAGTCQ